MFWPNGFMPVISYCEAGGVRVTGPKGDKITDPFSVCIPLKLPWVVLSLLALGFGIFLGSRK